jgi:RNA polymerase sigma-70 factor (ECF subfamily)
MASSWQIVAQPLDPEADDGRDFGEFFVREQARLFHALIVVTRSVEEAEELTQEAFVRLWEHWNRVSIMNDPVGYLYRTALNAHFQARRRAMRAVRAALHIRVGRDPIQEVETRDVLQRALLELPRRQRAALVLTELLGYDSSHAGAILGILPGTVRTLVSKARAKLAWSLVPDTG